MARAVEIMPLPSLQGTLLGEEQQPPSSRERKAITPCQPCFFSNEISLSRNREAAYYIYQSCLGRAVEGRGES